MSVALLLSCLPVAGCGTVANLANQRPGAGGVAPFGGVRQDVQCIQQASNGELAVRGHPKSEPDHYPQRALMLFCAADLPLSLIGDIVTWPYTYTYTFINQPVPVPPVIQTLPVPAGPPATLPPPSDTPPMPTPTPPEGQAKAKSLPKIPVVVDAQAPELLRLP